MNQIVNLLGNLVVTIDNAGSVGEKEYDKVYASYDIVSYYTLRNAIMENMTHNTIIKAFTFSNFCGDDAYHKLVQGIEKILSELKMDIPYVTSTESNFSMKESAFSVTVIGEKKEISDKRFNNYAVIGIPLVGNEILKQKDDIITIDEFLYLLNHKNVSRVFTVGSKGINNRAIEYLGVRFHSISIDLNKSAGPSTCVIVEYDDINCFSENIMDKLTKLTII